MEMEHLVLISTCRVKGYVSLGPQWRNETIEGFGLSHKWEKIVIIIHLYEKCTKILFKIRSDANEKRSSINKETRKMAYVVVSGAVRTIPTTGLEVKSYLPTPDFIKKCACLVALRIRNNELLRVFPANRVTWGT